MLFRATRHPVLIMRVLTAWLAFLTCVYLGIRSMWLILVLVVITSYVLWHLSLKREIIRERSEFLRSYAVRISSGIFSTLILQIIISLAHFLSPGNFHHHRASNQLVLLMLVSVLTYMFLAKYGTKLYVRSFLFHGLVWFIPIAGIKKQSLLTFLGLAHIANYIIILGPHHHEVLLLDPLLLFLPFVSNA